MADCNWTPLALVLTAGCASAPALNTRPTRLETRDVCHGKDGFPLAGDVM